LATTALECGACTFAPGAVHWKTPRILLDWAWLVRPLLFSTEGTLKLKILYDNRALEGFRADWGFACLVEAQEVVLFDTGADGSVLRHNMARPP